MVSLNYGVLTHSEAANVWASSINGKTTLVAMTANLADIDQTQGIYTYVSTDDGYSWDLIGKTQCGESITRPRELPNELFIYGNTSCVMRSRNGGLDWELLPGVGFPYAGGHMTTLQFDSNTPDIAYYSVGVNERHLYRYQYHPESKQGQAVDLKTLAVEMLVDESNHANLFTDTALLSADGGWTWADKSKQLAKACKCNVGSGYPGAARLLSFRNGEIRALIIHDGNMAWNGFPGDIAIVRSTDLGDTWDTVTKLDIHGLMGGPFINPDDAMNVFIVAVTAPKGTSGFGGMSYRPDIVKVLETKDGGASWNEIYRHTASVQSPGRLLVRGVAQIKRAGGRSILMATKEGLMRSEDEGRTWTTLGGLR